MTYIVYFDGDLAFTLYQYLKFKNQNRIIYFGN